MLYEFKLTYCYKTEDNGETEYFYSSFPMFAENWTDAKRKAVAIIFDTFGGINNPFTIYGGAKVTLLYYFVSWKITP